MLPPPQSAMGRFPRAGRILREDASGTTGALRSDSVATLTRRSYSTARKIRSIAPLEAKHLGAERPASLGSDVTLHTLRHTFAHWYAIVPLMGRQAGRPSVV